MYVTRSLQLCPDLRISGLRFFLRSTLSYSIKSLEVCKIFFQSITMNIVTRDILVNLKFHTQCWAKSHYRPIFILAWIKSAGKSNYIRPEMKIKLSLRQVKTQTSITQGKFLGRNRRLRRAPYVSSVPLPNGSWFQIHYNDRTIPENFFRQQLRMNRATFDTVDISSKNTCHWIVSWKLSSKDWPNFQCWKVYRHSSCARCSWLSL